MENESNARISIQEGTLLKEQYKLGRVLGEGGFAITYLAYDLNNKRQVAVKEYFPVSFATREYVDFDWNLHIFRGEKEEGFKKGKDRFLREAEILKEFSYLDGIVSVIDSFEENRTAYIVMEYIEGITLKQYVRDNGCLSYEEMTELFFPVMRALSKLHIHKLIHRDISPDNLMIGTDNRMYLIDFGAAAELDSFDKRTVTVMLKSGYAPPEQYASDGKQGAWTDVYALCATIYFALTGEVPADSVLRLQGDKDISFEKLTEGISRIKQWQVDALKKGLSIRVTDRFADMEGLYDALSIEPSVENNVTVMVENPSSVHNLLDKSSEKIHRSRKRFLIVGLAVLVVFLFAFALRTAVYNMNVSEGDAISGDADGGDFDVSNDDASDGDTSGDSDTDASDGDSNLYEMPDVTGLTLERAKQKIYAVDNQIKIIENKEYDDSASYGTVTYQDVAAGTVYSEGAISEITLTISMGSESADILSDDDTDATEDATTKKATTESSSSTKATTEKATTESSSTIKATTEKTTESASTTKTTTESTDDFDISGYDDYSDFQLGD